MKIESGQTHSITTLESLKDFAQALVAKYPKGCKVGLKGDLGAGKTTFVRLVIENLCEKQSITVPRVTSPSFTIHQSYPNLNPRVEHFDFYRLTQVNENTLLELGFYDLVPECYVFMEWCDRIEKNVLKYDVELDFIFSEDCREIKVLKSR
jgi:tRNA threonylcarbamoyl adenosine modification protein YjeE